MLTAVAPADAAATAQLLLQFDRLEAILRARPVGRRRPRLRRDRVVRRALEHPDRERPPQCRRPLERPGSMRARSSPPTTRYRSARIDWAACERQAPAAWAGVSGSPRRLLTQGFIGRAPDGTTTTLGREGSDFSAAILAYLLECRERDDLEGRARDVQRGSEAVPRHDSCSRTSATGRRSSSATSARASSTRGRCSRSRRSTSRCTCARSPTLRRPAAPSTITVQHDSLVPSFIVKPKQLLISITPRDLSFIVEENLSDIFGLFAQRQRTHRPDAEQRGGVQRRRGRHPARPRPRRGVAPHLRGPLQRRVRAGHGAALRRADAGEAHRGTGTCSSSSAAGTRRASSCSDVPSARSTRAHPMA